MRTPTTEPSGRSATTSRRRLLQATTATLGLTAGFVAGSGTAVGQSEGRKEIRRGTVELIEPEEASDFEYPYLLYRPDTNSKYERPLFVKPLNNPSVPNRSELRDQLIGGPTAARHPTFVGARANAYPGIVPGFPRTPNDDPDYIQTMALPSYRSELFPKGYRLDDLATEAFPADSLKRIDQQLLAMIEDAKARLADAPYTVADQIHLGGFSASATFSNRFTFLYPEKVETLSTGGSNVLPLPKGSHDETSLAYPLGTADYEQLTGREFDLEAWAAVNQYLYVGQEDQPMPSTDSRGYYYGSGRYPDTVEEVYGRNRVTERFPFVKEEYTTVSDSAKFEIYEGMGHEMNEATRDAIKAFHLEHSPTPNPSSVEGTDESQSNSQAPGFGIGAALLGLGGAIVAARGRSET